MKKTIYLDHAATTYIKEEVLNEMYPYLTKKFGNPSSIHSLGINSKLAIECSRYNVANALKCDVGEVYFTSSGTEANNWAIIGVAFANKSKGNHIITTQIEHPSVLKTCEYLSENGFEITYLKVNEYGMISLDELKASISRKTILISIMFANNVVGTIQPVKEIGQIAKERNILFHTDAVQAVGSVPIDVKEYNIDLLSLSGHKIYAPKGIGALFIRNGTHIEPLIHGGSQESGMRSGTENVAGIVGLGKAIEIATKNIHHNNKKIKFLRDRFVNEVLNKIPDTRLNGHPTERLPGYANISFKYVKGKILSSILNDKGIYVSTNSACSCASSYASYVLQAMRLPEEIIFSSIRFTFGDKNTENDIDIVVNTLSETVDKIRKGNFARKIYA